MAWWMALLWLGVQGVEPSGSVVPIGWMTFAERADEAEPLWRQAQEALAEDTFRWLTEAEIGDKLREVDGQEGRMEKAKVLIRQGEELQLALDLEAAWEEYHRAEILLEEGFVRYYEPALLAQAVLRQGVVRQLQGDLPSARLFFQRALRLAPDLKLSQAYFSPSVRKAFLQAGKEMSPEPARAPLDEERSRLCLALQLPVLLLGEHHPGQQEEWRLSLFLSSSAKTVLQLSPRRTERGLSLSAEDLELLRTTVARGTGVGLAPGPRKLQGLAEGPPRSAWPLGPPDAGRPRGPSGPRPWYIRHWWIWPTVAVVVGLSVALPLTVFRSDVVEVELHD